MIFQRPLLPLLLMIGMTIAVSCAPVKSPSPETIKLAVIADIHLSNVYGKLIDNDYKGLKNIQNGKYAHIRTMESQLHSTRIFNENYFAFLSAMDHIVDRNIKYVILPGDFSDDGQPIHIRGLKEILNHYTATYGIKFFLITGNHDVVQPYNNRDGKRDFLGVDGKAQPIMSEPGMYTSNPIKEHPVVISNDLQNLGYEEITKILGDYGFFPRKEYRYWETPFSNYDYENYSFHKAEQTADLTKRSHSIAPNSLPIPDISYLVEPVEGLWLLALDANTYLKKEKQGNDPSRPEYPNTGLGLNNLLENKKYLLDWVRKVADNAQKLGKTLIAFSHYPMVEFNDGASPEMEELLIGSKMQLKRIPDKRVAQLFAQAGLKLHLGGHMHLNDTGVSVSSEGNTLFNIQTPSLAAYKPAFKILTLKEGGFVEVETIVMDSVPKYKDFFGLYHQEYSFLEHLKEGRIWNKEVLSSQNYGEFMEWHLKELVRLRFLPDEWPTDLKDFLVGLSGKELLLLSMDTTSRPLGTILENLRNSPDKTIGIPKSAEEEIKKTKVVIPLFEEWSGQDLLLDLYRLRSADRLALKDIGDSRTKQYRLIIDYILHNPAFKGKADPMKRNMYLLASIFNKFLLGAPSDHFQLNLNNGTIISLKQPIYENK